MPDNCNDTNGQWVVYSEVVSSDANNIFISSEDLSSLANASFRIKSNLPNGSGSIYRQSNFFNSILITPTPTITVTSSITPTISVTPSFTPTISLTPSFTPTISNTPTYTPTISLTSSRTPTITPSITETKTNTPTYTPTNSVTRTQTITPSTTIPYFPPDVFLQMNSGDPFIDSFDESRTITTHGTPTISTEVKYAGAGSLLLDGNSYLSTSHNSDFDLSGDFTIDFWIRPTSITAQNFAYIFITSQSNDGLFITWNQYASNTINVGQVGTADIITSTNTAPLNEWTRITITRQSNLIKLFINSALDSSENNSTNFTSDNSNEARFGEGENPGVGAGFIGYIDEFKIINGVAVSPIAPVITPTITPTISITPSKTPTLTPTPTSTNTNVVLVDVCDNGPDIRLGVGRKTQYIYYYGSGCITNRIIRPGGTTGGAALISSGSGPLIFTSNIGTPFDSGNCCSPINESCCPYGSKPFILGGSNTDKNRINRLRDPWPGAGANGRIRLSKENSGTWVITGTSGNYSGGTTINQGTLIVSSGNVNSSGNLNGPLGIGSVSLGSSSSSLVNTKAALLLDEGVTFNRNVFITHYRDASQETSIPTQGITWRQNNSSYQEVIIGGANTSGECIFGNSWNIIPNHSGNISNITFQAATGGTVRIGYGLGVDTKHNTTFYFGTPDNSGIILCPTIAERSISTVTNVVVDNGTVVLNDYPNGYRGTTLIRNGTVVLKTNSAGVQGGGFGYIGGYIVLGDTSDPNDITYQFPKTYMGNLKDRIGAVTGDAIIAMDSGTNSYGVIGESIIRIPPLYNNDNQRVIFEGRANNSRVSSVSTILVDRDVTLRALTTKRLQWDSGLQSISDIPGQLIKFPFYSTSNLIIGDSGYLGTVDYNSGIIFGSVIIRDGLCRTANYQLFQTEYEIPLNPLDYGEGTVIVPVTNPVIIDGDYAEFNYNGKENEINDGGMKRLLSLIKGTLSGAGPISCPHSLTIGSGVTLYPGNHTNFTWGVDLAATGLSQIYSSGLYLNSGGKLKIRIDDGSTHNQAIVPNSGVFINSTESEPFIVEINPYSGIIPDSFTIISNSATLDGFNSNKFTLINNNPSATGIFSLSSSSSDIILTYTE